MFKDKERHSQRQCRTSCAAVRDDFLIKHLVRLEKALHKPSFSIFNKLLHTKFFEFQRSGGKIRKKDALKSDFGKNPHLIISDNFKLTRLSIDSVLLTYRSATKLAKNQIIKHARRSSIWICENGKWQMLFHQGTPTKPFKVKTAC